MARVNPTRMELLALKAQIGTASEGARLLKGKRDALMKEFLKAVDRVVDSRHELSDLCRAGMNTVNAARALEGSFALESAAMGTRRALPLEVHDMRIWGVAVPEIEVRDLGRAFDARGYSPATTPVLIEETAAAFERILNQALVIAVQETRLRRLGEEVRATSSRVNALEQILIPGLRQDVAGILAVLEERSREEVFRLKRLKRRSRSAQAAPADAAPSPTAPPAV